MRQCIDIVDSSLYPIYSSLASSFLHKRQENEFFLDYLLCCCVLKCNCGLNKLKVGENKKIIDVLF